MTLEGKVRESKVGVKIDQERCKGCGLCIEFCKKNCLEISKKSNKIGYFPAKVKENYNCIGCGNCYLTCADYCIEIYEDG